MFGISSVGASRGYAPYYYNNYSTALQRRGAPSSTQAVSPVAAAQTTPVQPVARTAPVQRGVTQPVPQESQLPVAREGADPVEMAVRGRIQYGEQEILPPQLEMAQGEQELQEANISYFVEYGGKAITQGGKTVSGEWIDTVRFMWWLKSFMQECIYNLFVTHPKIPYTDNGITQVQNQMVYALKRGQAMGGIAPTEYDEDGNATPGYTTTVPRARDLTQAERASRQLKGCKFTARLAGAIHYVEVRGTLEY